MVDPFNNDKSGISAAPPENSSLPADCSPRRAQSYGFDFSFSTFVKSGPCFAVKVSLETI